MNDFYITTKVYPCSKVLVMMLILILAIISSLTVSCESEPPPALEPKPESTISRLPPEPKLPSGPYISIGEVKVAIDEVVSLDIEIDNITNGISGYDLKISLTDEGIAQIVEIVLPELGLSDVGSIPNNKVTIRVVDLNDVIPSGKEKALLAKLKLQGIRLGMSNIDVVVYAMDDDGGDPIEPYVASGTIEVR